jgi:hypothetical protein
MNRSTRWTAGLLAATAALAADSAEGPTGPAPPHQPARVDMRAIAPHASRLGHADLVFHAEGTSVVVWVAPISGLTLPMHLYTYVHQGSCTSLGPRATEAPRRVLGYRDPSGLWTVRNTMSVSADTLRTSPHALTVWSGPPDGNQMLYCGDVRMDS